MQGWKYYNHAIVPETAPHEAAKLTALYGNDIWKEYRKALFATWTENFDCGYETNWWYIVKYAPFSVERLDPKTRKHIRQSYRKVFVKQIDPTRYVKELYQVHTEAFGRYKNTTMRPPRFDDFAASISCANGQAWWAAFSLSDGRMVAYMMCKECKDYVELRVSKFSAEKMNLRASDALHYALLDYYLNIRNYRYITSGSRSVNHDTNVQQYKIDTFQFCKAYCKLHIIYRPSIRWIMPCLRLMKKPLQRMDHIGIVHQINSVLRMDSYAEMDRV